MSEIFNIEIIGRSGGRLSLLEDALLVSSQFRIKRRLIIDFEVNIFMESQNVDVIILDLSEEWEKELTRLGSLRRKSDHIPTVVIGDDDRRLMLKMAMKAGARDFYTHPVPGNELVDSVLQICQEKKQSNIPKTNISVVTHGKGGSGASFFASNIAHLLASERRRESTMLLDLNFITGELPLHFDLSGGSDLRQALEFVDSVDELALKAFTMCHNSGVHVMASNGEPIKAGWGVNAVNLDALISMVSTNYSQIIIDLPNPTEPYATDILVKANRIFVVIQQSLMDIHCTKHLLLTPEFNDVIRDNLTIVVNRFENRNAVRYQDIQAAFDGIKIEYIPNDYKRVSESINTGIPLAARWNKAPVTCALREVAFQLLGLEKKNISVMESFKKILGSKK